MNYNHLNRNSSTIGIWLMCAIVFLLFSFGFLYRFQSDVMALAQHVLSHGMTTYNALISAVLVTLLLQALQLLVFGLLKLGKRSHALTYLPSMLMLAFLTDINSDIDQRFSLGAWWWVLPLVLVLWWLLTLLVKALQDVEPAVESTGLFSRAMWINMVTMALLIIGVVSISNTNAVFHYRARVEAKLLKRDYAGALDIGKKSLESDASLQMLRMYALSRTGQLGERLFAYPVSGGSDVMLPVEGKSRFSMYPVDSLYRYLGARPVGAMTNQRYLELLLRRDTVDDRRIADYQLCGLLLDKKLDGFVSLLQHSYAEGDTLDMDRLPRHYREAMTLYTHLRSNPLVIYHNAVMDEDWENLQELERQYPDRTARKVKVGETYRDTYWYYYEYE